MKFVQVIASLHKKLKTSGLYKALTIWLVWLCMVLALRTIAISVVHQPQNEYNPPINTSFFLQGGVKWDSFYYLKITEEGYGAAQSSLPAFYPGFPYLVRIASQVLGVGPVLAGFAINILATMAAAVFLFLIAKQYLQSQKAALFAVLLFLFSPFSYFLLAFYTEAIFCALSFGVFYFARRGNWLVASLLCIPLTAVRLPALLVFAALTVEYASSIGWSLKRLTKDALYLLLAPAGFLLYMYFLWRRFGDPLMFKNAYRFGWQYQVFQPNISKTIQIQSAQLTKSLTSPPEGWKDDWFQGVAMGGLQLGAWMVGFGFTLWGVLKKLPLSWVLYLASGQETLTIMRKRLMQAIVRLLESSLIMSRSNCWPKRVWSGSLLS